MSELKKIERALISVSDKTGLVEFAESLAEFGVKIISTGGTAATLRAAGIDVTEVSDVTGFPEMMDGRVKTLHPKIHGGFLALRDNDEHIRAMTDHGIEPIDLVCVNLYPFEKTVAKDDVTLEDAVENIDIGGPAMIRSASKNWRDVAVVTDSALYEDIIGEMNATAGSLSLATRRRLAVLAYTRTASYDLAISRFLAGQLDDADLELLEPLNPLKNLMFIESDGEDRATDQGEFPEFELIEIEKVSDLRYGENPHQRAALYRSETGGGIAGAEQLHGKEMSFNNYVDADAAWNLINEFEETAVAIIKHTNPSGVGTGASTLEAYRRALATDPVSAFGGIVAVNRTVDAETAEAINEVFTEVVIAPDFTPDALAVLSKKKNQRVIRIATVATGESSELKPISGGYLLQNKDLRRVTSEDLRFVTDRRPTDEEVRAMLFAWKVCKHVKSNAIVFANGEQTLGVGAGQMNRVDSVRIAAVRAERFGLSLKGSVVASDAFFPFRDNVDEAAAFGVAAIIQPGGSMRDEESIAAANEHKIAMAFTGVRHFKH
ncbi:MAG: bifunctional phosphoribosylaminoimidazolecarboxamide formyltransferase/IMP cyclohydrolase [Acidobacteria bacterium]|nr:bifunctional phosphoribosylaminoimidazolecarboxamide formyltransferase/IMP cyclohydrolase [Acidobacteriota bacterium]